MFSITPLPFVAPCPGNVRKCPHKPYIARNSKNLALVNRFVDQVLADQFPGVRHTLSLMCIMLQIFCRKTSCCRFHMKLGSHPIYRGIFIISWMQQLEKLQRFKTVRFYWHTLHNVDDDLVFLEKLRFISEHRSTSVQADIID